MKLIKPFVEHWANKDNNVHAIKCAQVCYASDTDIKNPEAWLDAKIKAGHLSIFRHQTYYFLIPTIVITQMMEQFFINSPYVGYYKDKEWGYVSVNGQTYIEVKWLTHLFKYSSSELGLMNVATENGCARQVERILRRTMYIITQISTSRELNRVSPNNICEQSTRYCNFTKDKFNGEVKICQPWWFDDEKVDAVKQNHYLKGIEIATNVYKELVDSGMRPQDARGVLPLDTATTVVYTYRVEEWAHIINLRYYGTAGTPHPNAKIIANMIREELNGSLIENYFNEDLEV